MKTKKINKLMFNKSTVADLNKKELGYAHGGSITENPPTLEPTICRSEGITLCPQCPSELTCQCG